MSWVPNIDRKMLQIDTQIMCEIHNYVCVDRIA